ncbi:MATE family multidrug resistance protein [Ereboglobus sp. PH5-5]|uniref:MATE family efflux transporter n=1 Tax=Ereboglobus sp. PH5-5 TaxID=2940529 RepID=UPI0024062ACA|nr:MATE family efflux transporter [Ereboglobus sp. PH5-5]MDF9832798.1 MATE family multidrug resistance protein [Ereboglobus sp. PH5-5]
MASRAQSYLSEARGTLLLAVPIIAGQVGQIAMGITDSYMISLIGDKVSFAASAFAGNIFNMFYIAAIGLLASVPVLVARAHGENNARECGELLRHGLLMAVVFCAIEMAGLFVLSYRLHLFDQPAAVVAAAGAYFRIVAVSLAPVMIFQVLRQYSEAMGRPWEPMFILIACVFLNVALNWVLIYGNLGAPRLGLVGAGWATLISRVAAASALFWWLRRAAAAGDADDAAREAWPARWFFATKGSRVMAMLRIGVPTSGQLLFESVAFAAAAVMMGWFNSVDPIAAHQIAMNCAAFTFMFVLGLATAASIRVGQCAGAGERERVRTVGFGAMAMCVLWMAFTALVISLGRWTIAGWFKQDAAVTALAAQLLLVAAVFQIFDGVQVVGAGMLRGLTDVKVPTVVTFVAYWVVALPLGYFYGVRGDGGPVGVWIALALALAVAAVTLSLRFARLTRTGHGRGFDGSVRDDVRA